MGLILEMSHRHMHSPASGQDCATQDKTPTLHGFEPQLHLHV